MHNSKLILELDEEQARQISFACEMIARLKMGQFSELGQICYRSGYVKNTDQVSEAERILMETYFPEIVERYGHTASYGISSPEIDNSARTLFDVHQVIRNKLAWKRNLLGGWAVNYDRPIRMDNDHQLPYARFGDEYDNIYISFFSRMNLSIKQMIRRKGWEGKDVEDWIERCKDFALREYAYIKSMQQPFPEEEYLMFFNEKKEGEFVVWNESSD